ncbi:TniB family NTP-binding protein [Brevibacillus sp. M2.1A]|uniref:AAA family ATPase n=1 Tax=Brevibacillus sp. M2.1A TaxID=2738980 RepID=UPI00156B4FE6|nr:TniB family NTP-binding protein [Brevibacillus sp. M2.1A]MCC8438561.1 TniB family NTP-binding protein [Brevibacillus sp. M2.1A]
METSNRSFPVQLLEQPIEDRIQYFKKYTVAHPLLIEAFNKLTNNLLNPGNQSIFFVYGPSGSGKSTLFLKIRNKIIQEFRSEIEKNRGIIPIMGVEAVAPENGNFNWKDFYLQSLDAFYEPAIDYKVDYDSLFSNRLVSALRRDDPTRKYRKALASTLKYRETKAFLIDEAQHIAKITSGRKLLNQMDVIKSFASESNIPIVLIGSYEILAFRNLSAQLSRRSDDVHLPRYRMEKEGDMEKFVNILWTFQKLLPLEEEPDLISYSEEFYQRSIGCVGILKDWLLKTLEIQLKLGKRQLAIDDFMLYAHTIDRCLAMIMEAREGEAQLEESDEKKQYLMSLLKGGSHVYQNQEDEKKSNKVLDERKKGGKKVGVRNPKRDKVGVDDNVI